MAPRKLDDNRLHGLAAFPRERAGIHIGMETVWAPELWKKDKSLPSPESNVDYSSF
jgi:hypothetical protein